MKRLELFPREEIIGVFRGFREGGLEFHADLVLPYRNDFQSRPMHGQFLLVQLETPDEAVLGRIVALATEGRLSSPSGEEFNIRAVREQREIPDDLREDYLRYRVTIRVLGVLRHDPTALIFVPSHRRLPHLGSAVAFPSAAVLAEIAGHNIAGAEIGYFALGEYLYGNDPARMVIEPWMQFREPAISVKFPMHNLVARRTFVFARAGFGKSNLNKLLFSALYRETPTVTKRGGREVPVGTIIFDPDGEYFWPDDRGRPGLADVPHLVDRLVVFTSRRGPSGYYQAFVAGGIKLDIRRMRPNDVIAIALAPERQEQQNVRKLAGMPQGKWEQLVDLIDRNGNGTDLAAIGALLDLDSSRQELEAIAARSNMSLIVKMLHDKSSQLMDMLLEALAAGKLCVVDVSQLRGAQALVLSGLILRRIFDRNQEEFTAAEPKTIPTIAVVEEAQAVLNERAASAEPYITWVKEGRKYDLGAVLITQQPGSIPTDILSQGDNWFLFHLLSAADLTNVQRANAHFSADLLSALLNEPIPGQGVFWSSAGGKPYPVPLRVFSFERLYQAQDPDYRRAAPETYARRLKQRYHAQVQDMERVTVAGRTHANGQTRDVGPVTVEPDPQDGDDGAPDYLAIIKTQAITGLRANVGLIERISQEGVPWYDIKLALLEQIPETVDDRDNLAYRLVVEAMTQLFGPQHHGWHAGKTLTGRTTVQAGPG